LEELLEFWCGISVDKFVKEDSGFSFVFNVDIFVDKGENGHEGVFDVLAELGEIVVESLKESDAETLDFDVFGVVEESIDEESDSRINVIGEFKGRFLFGEAERDDFVVMVIGLDFCGTFSLLDEHGIGFEIHVEERVGFEVFGGIEDVGRKANEKFGFKEHVVNEEAEKLDEVFGMIVGIDISSFENVDNTFVEDGKLFFEGTAVGNEVHDMGNGSCLLVVLASF